MNKRRYWNCFGLSITSHWICTIRWLFCTFFWQSWWIKGFPWCGSVFSWSGFFEFWCWSNRWGVLLLFLRVGLIVRVYRPDPLMASLGSSSLVDRVVWHSSLRLLIRWELWIVPWCHLVWWAFFLSLELRIFLHDVWLLPLAKSWSWAEVVK